MIASLFGRPEPQFIPGAVSREGISFQIQDTFDDCGCCKGCDCDVCFPVCVCYGNQNAQWSQGIKK